MTSHAGAHDQVAPRMADASESLLAAALLGIAGNQLGGAAVVSTQGAAFEAWLTALGGARPEFSRPRRLPPTIDIRNLEEGEDLIASLSTGRPVRRSGILDTLSGEAILLTGAERWSTVAAARLLAACEKKGKSLLLALDEAAPDDEPMTAVLADRLALRVMLDSLRAADLVTDASWRSRIAAAVARFDHVVIPGDLLTALISASAALGISSSRTDIFVVTAARAHAAWRGAIEVEPEDAEVAARLVLAHRARRLPAPKPVPEANEQAPTCEPSAGGAGQAAAEPETAQTAAELGERLLAATASALPSGLLASMRDGGGQQRTGTAAVGRASGTRRKARHGRPVGSAPGDPRRDGPLNLLATVATAAPWQNLRRRMLGQNGQSDGPKARRVIVLPGDIRVTRYRSHAPATTVFAIDASGSSALHRMAEAKGAIEVLLADCYVRREKVAVVAFRGPRAEVLLPPTRALARARRALSGLPGGGATPLASGIDAARTVALSARRTGDAVLIVLLTDGRANIDRSGAADRRQAADDAADAARCLAADAFSALLIDTSPVPGPRPAELARIMRARYIPLPHAGAQEIAGAVMRAGASPQ